MPSPTGSTPQILVVDEIMHKKGRIIAFDRRKRLIQSARAVVRRSGNPGDVPRRTISLLYQAVAVADDLLAHQILLFMGNCGHPAALSLLYRIMSDSHLSEELRQVAALQIAVAISCFRRPGPLARQLIKDLQKEDPFERSLAVLALGWKGNQRAIRSLIKALHDPEAEVQQAAVTAIANLEEIGLLAVLTERLKSASTALQQTILYHLDRFSAQDHQVAEIYLDCLKSADENLRYDALVLLSRRLPPEALLEVYRTCLKDPSIPIRQLALERLDRLAVETLGRLKASIEPLSGDPHPPVRRLSRMLLDRLARRGG
jgi:hypothetical protein